MIGLFAIVDSLPAWLPGLTAVALSLAAVVVALWRELIAVAFWLSVWGILSRGPLGGFAESVDRYAVALLGTF